MCFSLRTRRSANEQDNKKEMEKNSGTRLGIAPVDNPRCCCLQLKRQSGADKSLGCSTLPFSTSFQSVCGISPALTKQLLPPSFANNQANTADEDTAGSAHIAFYSSASTCNSAAVTGTWQEPLEYVIKSI